VRIVSVNAWGGALFDRLIAWLPACAADVVCLQEVTRTPGLAGWTQFDDTEHVLAQRADLFDDVRAALPRHQAAFFASDAGPVYDRDGARYAQDFGLGLFVDQRYAITASHAGFVHGAFMEHDQWPTDSRPRAAQAVRLLDDEAQRTVTVVHLHGLRDPRGKGDTPARRAQAGRIAEFVAQIAAPEDLTVVCGDLNLLPDSETFDVLASIGLTDLVTTADTRTSYYPKPVRHAGYLLVSDPSAVRRFEILAEPEVSDHRALLLDL
jgi:endonuclease/exonuclease/phosphatase family metal-dependent hydrolase